MHVFYGEKSTGHLVKKICNVSSVIPLDLTDIIFVGRAQYKQHTVMLLNNRDCVRLIWIIRLPWYKGQYTSHSRHENVKLNGLQ